ncbi:MAG TPA: hypothetical protein VN805_17060 [Caulobacteraceae bacterium]|nr:hypothetical protein [Caulobacteraceae bacterium]
MPARPGPLALAAVAIVVAATGAASAASPTSVPLDTETTVGGVPVACTGVGESKLNPHWNSYPVRVEFSGADNGLLADEALTIFDDAGAEVVSVACAGPWILLKLPPGSYRIEGRLPKTQAMPQSGYFRVTPDGPVHLELRFPDA